MALSLFSPLLSALTSACVYAYGLRRQKRNIRLFESPAAAASLETLRPDALRKGRRLLAVEAAYLLFVLTLAATGLSHEPGGAPIVTLILALTISGAIALLAETYLAAAPSRRHLVLPPLLIVVFGVVYPVLH